MPNWVILTVGVQAETRIVPSETKPDCPFPAQLEIVPPIDQGKVAIAVPIDVPFTELNRMMEAQLKGKTFPETATRRSQVTVQARDARGLRRPAADLAARQGQGEEELVRLRRRGDRARLGQARARPASSRSCGSPTSTLDVESEAAFGLLGAAARAAIPYLQKALADNAVIDLKPFAANARKSIEAAIADFQKQADGVEVEAAVTGLRLVGIEFDAKTLRVIAEADGTARALVTQAAIAVDSGQPERFALPGVRGAGAIKIDPSELANFRSACRCARSSSARSLSRTFFGTLFAMLNSLLAGQFRLAIFPYAASSLR